MNENLTKRNSRFAVAIVSLVSLITISCGGAESQTTTAQTVNSQSLGGQDPKTSVTGTPSDVLNSISGNYIGTLYKRQTDGTWVAQPYGIKLTQSTSASNTGKTYLSLQFESSGPLGSINFSNYLGLTLSGYYGNYSFASNVTRADAMYDIPFSIELDFTFSNGTNVSPTRSLVYIRDCGFSQSAACTNLAQDVAFGSDLRKR